MQAKKTKKEKTERKSLEGPYQSPKGMRDLLGKEFYAYHGLFEKAAEVAIYYGFTPIETPILEQEEVFIRGVGEGTDIVDKELYTLRTKGGDRLALRPEFTAGVMRAYLEHGMQSLPQPVMLYSFGNLYRHDKPQRGRYRELRQLNLDSIGDKDCRPNYRRELVNYYRKNLGKVCVDCVERFKTNPMRLLDCKEEHTSELQSHVNLVCR